MTSLTELLAMVEAGAYAPDADYKPKRYSAFADDMAAAGIPSRVSFVLMDALRNNCAKYVLRALIAKESDGV